MAKKWRELTSIEDYEFDPDGKYDGSLSKEQIHDLFTELMQRAETTEEYLDNAWIDPPSTRNAYTFYVENGADYVILKYYDGMYALYEIRDEEKIDEARNKSVAACVIEKLDQGVSVRQAIVEAIQGKDGLFEDIVGMTQETSDKLLDFMNEWTGGSGKGGWEYSSKKTDAGDKFTISITKNPVGTFDSPIDLEMNGTILNGETYYEPAGEFLAASGPVTFTGLKSIIRDLTSQVEMAQADQQPKEQGKGDIYGY